MASDAPSTATSRYERYVFFCFFVLNGLLVIGSQVKSRGLLGRAPIFVQAIVAGVGLLAGVSFGLLLVKRDWRQKWMAFCNYNPRSLWTIVLLSLNTFYLVLSASLGFAVLSVFLHERGISDVLTAAGGHSLDDPINDMASHYFWNFLNAIPVLEVPRTVGWDLAFRFTDRVTPVLLLLYKLAVILPTVALGRMVVRDLRDRSGRRATETDEQEH